MSASTIIIGGGLAGMAAAAALAGHGVRVTLLESRVRLGGRASSFVDPASGETIDNCQHVSLGCCTNLQHFCRTVGTDGLFRTEQELTFVGPGGEIGRLREAPWPAPLHLLPSLMRLPFLSMRERLLLARGLRALARRRTANDAGTFADWLVRHGQTAALREKFWHVVLVSALSESLDRIAVGQARKVFVDSFLSNRSGWRMQAPTVPLDELYDRRTGTWLQTHGVDVRRSSPVEELEMQGGMVRAVRLRGGGGGGARVEGDDFILAAAHFRVRDLLPEPLRNAPELAGIAELQSAPISSVHLWFDRPITPLPHAAFVGRLCQWMFNRTAIWTERGEAQGLHEFAYQVVISASRDVRARSAEETIAAVRGELGAIWPEALAARLTRSRVVTEARAVFSPLPGVDALRPPQQTSIPNLQLAGDWTQTGWPSTMEGAVRSGYLAAENVLRRLGRPVRVRPPDLPVSRLSALLFGL